MSWIGAKRRAGISVPLFSLRSSQSWGLGEIGDLPRIAGWLRSGRQSLLQILPLNELAPGESSPYSSLSAMAIDPRYITISHVEDAADFGDECHKEIAAVRAAHRIDYARVSALKHLTLNDCFARFHQKEWLRRTARAEALRAFLLAEAWWLDDYSLYRAIRAQAGERPWTEWPLALRDRDPAALAEASRDLAPEILFYQYVQWIAAGQWDAARKRMADVEILGDFPFMVTMDSADVWSRQDEFVLDASVGTPPDAFSETGQEWGLPPYDWNRAYDNDFAWLRARARRMTALYDGFRVDHLVGFYRTFVRPADGHAPHFFPADEPEQLALGEAVMRIMIGTGADVSVEDLGTVPDFVRDSIAQMGLPGYRVFRWERKDPAGYPALSVAMTSTHDTEPLAVWWESLTLEERQLIAEMPSVAARHPSGIEGLSSSVFNESIRDAIVGAVVNSGSSLVLISIQDVFGWRDRINLPATIGEWNWTYVLPWPVDEMDTQPEAVDAAARLQRWSEQANR